MALVELQGIGKTFPGGTRALDGVDLVLREGEVRALLGENGAGKSTLTGVLFGLVRPDEGTVRLRGEAVSLSSPSRALELGIGLVHQHFALAPSLTVAENVCLGARGVRFDHEEAVALVAGLSARTGLAVDPRARTGDLPVGVRQRVEILKALRRDARVLLLDEPTAVLAPSEADDLFSVLRKLKGEGRSILFITHKLDEVARIADRVTVMRRGKIVAADLEATTPASELARLMMGEAPAVFSREVIRSGEERPVLELKGASLGKLRSVDLVVRAGELVAIAGIAGSGQDELFALATGLAAPESGQVLLLGAAEKADPRVFAARGVGAIPGDRHELAIASDLSCEENLALKEIATGRRFVRRGWLRRDELREAALARLTERDVRPISPGMRAGDLSGGNQQKLVLARELAGEPKLVVAFDPARGLDVAAQASTARALEAARARGAGVLLISTDLDEVVALGTRTGALHSGRLLFGKGRDELGFLMLRGDVGPGR